jgi:hypothetical protein
LCCVMGNARSARSNECRVCVTRGCCSKNLRYISQIRGILLRRMSARSKSAFTLRYSLAKRAAFSLATCLVRYLRYCERVSKPAQPTARRRKTTQNTSTYHFPKLVGTRELYASPLHHKRLLMYRSVLELVFDIDQPWLRAPRVSLNILFVKKIILALYDTVSNRVAEFCQVIACAKKSSHHKVDVGLTAKAVAKNCGGHRAVITSFRGAQWLAPLKVSLGGEKRKKGKCGGRVVTPF